MNNDNRLWLLLATIIFVVVCAIAVILLTASQSHKSGEPVSSSASGNNPSANSVKDIPHTISKDTIVNESKDIKYNYTEKVANKNESENKYDPFSIIPDWLFSTETLIISIIIILGIIAVLFLPKLLSYSQRSDFDEKLKKSSIEYRMANQPKMKVFNNVGLTSTADIKNTDIISNIESKIEVLIRDIRTSNNLELQNYFNQILSPQLKGIHEEITDTRDKQNALEEQLNIIRSGVKMVLEKLPHLEIIPNKSWANILKLFSDYMNTKQFSLFVQETHAENVQILNWDDYVRQGDTGGKVIPILARHEAGILCLMENNDNWLVFPCFPEGNYFDSEKHQIFRPLYKIFENRERQPGAKGFMITTLKKPSIFCRETSNKWKLLEKGEMIIEYTNSFDKNRANENKRELDN